MLVLVYRKCSTCQKALKWLEENKIEFTERAIVEENPTYEELKKKANRLYRTCFLYWEVLVANDLREEAYEYVREHIDEEWPFDSFDWDITP